MQRAHLSSTCILDGLVSSLHTAPDKKEGDLLVLFHDVGVTFAPFSPKNFLLSPLELSTAFKNN